VNDEKDDDDGMAQEKFLGLWEEQ